MKSLAVGSPATGSQFPIVEDTSTKMNVRTADCKTADCKTDCPIFAKLKLSSGVSPFCCLPYILCLAYYENKIFYGFWFE